MKLLYLHDGQHEIDKIVFDMGFDVVSFNIDTFDYNLYLDNHLMFYGCVYHVEYQSM